MSGTIDYIHLDHLWGPSQVRYLLKGDARYFVTFIDDYSCSQFCSKKLRRRRGGCGIIQLVVKLIQTS
jgi:hypothetical protein